MSDKRPNGMRSNAENILRATLGEAVEYDNPNSPVEYYLVKLKEAIEEGGGGGGDVIQILARLSQCERDIDALELADTNLANALQELVSVVYTKTEIDAALSGKQNTEVGKGLSTNDYTTAEKTKLSNIEEGANKTVVDSSLSSSSTNPVQNKAVKEAIDSKADKSTTYTKTEVDTALNEKALQSQADWNTNHGFKNVATENTFTATLRKTLTIAGELSGKITVSMGNITSTDTDDTRCRILFEYKDGGSGGDIFCQRNTSYKQDFDIGTHILDKITIYASDNYAHSSGDIVTVTELMVKPTTIGDDTYQPYRPSYDELIARIEALENA